MLDGLVKVVDDTSKLLLSEKRRSHLGASQVGNSCLRAVWYTFRWAFEEQFDGRKLRLFKRGHEEEDRIYRWLRAAGFEIQDYEEMLVWHPGSESYATLPWDAEWNPTDDLDLVYDDVHHIAMAKRQGVELKQWGFVDFDGHFAGSSDGKVRFPPGFILDNGEPAPEGQGLGECKTHNDKSFKSLKKDGVAKSKPVHYTQMQVYMHYLGLPWALYCAVNKNDDELYFELVYYDRSVAERFVDFARKVIPLKYPPRKLSENPSWFECKWCEFHEICHHGGRMEINCRSCAFAEPGQEGSWYCLRWHQTIPKDYIPKACGDWEQIA